VYDAKAYVDSPCDMAAYTCEGPRLIKHWSVARRKKVMFVNVHHFHLSRKCTIQLHNTWNMY